MSSSVACSIFTARTVTTSSDSCKSGRTRSSSNLDVSTCVRSRPRDRDTWRKNTDFRTFTSTRVRERSGRHSLMGMAGDPPPDPMSNSDRDDAGMYRTATAGSISSRSTASSEPSPSSDNAVRLILRFQRANSAKYASKPSRTDSGRSRPTTFARRRMRSRSRLPLTSQVLTGFDISSVRQVRAQQHDRGARQSWNPMNLAQR